MTMQRILPLLDEYAARFPGELVCVQRFQTFIAEYPDCLYRTQQRGHLTGSAWVVDRTGTRVLLLHHRKLGIWIQPGGHADGDPDLHAVALREAYEETGLETLTAVSHGLFDLDIHEIPARAGEPAHLHFDARFAFQATGSEEFLVSEESLALAWVRLDRLEQTTREESILRMADKWSHC